MDQGEHLAVSLCPRRHLTGNHEAHDVHEGFQVNERRDYVLGACLEVRQILSKDALELSALGDAKGIEGSRKAPLLNLD